MVKRRIVVPLLLVAAAFVARAEDLNISEALKSLLDNALEVKISARIFPAGTEQEPWTAESTRLTIPGRAVKVRLEGDNVQIYLICTPYVQENGEVLLLSQGQVWFTEPPEQEAKYFSTFYSIPVSYGEKVLYFPLGVTDAAAKEHGYFNIELEIVIVPYQKEEPQ
jgi:hypothetical protein